MIKTTIREIKGSLGRYLAILAIVMLGTGLFAGLKAAKPAMTTTLNGYLAQQNFFDYQLLSTMGFGQDQAEEFKQLEETADVEGAVSTDAVCSLEDGNELVYKIHTVPEKISRVVLTSGRMPERADECLLDDALYGAEDIGSKITVTDNNDPDTLEMFRGRTFTAVGTVHTPSYINFERGTSSIGEGKVTAFIYVPKEAFACDYFTEIYLTLKQKYDVYTEEYRDYLDTVSGEIEEKTEALAADRYHAVYTEAQEEIQDAQTQLDEEKRKAEKELADARQKISDAGKEVRKGKKELAEGEKELADGRKEIEKQQKKLADAEQKTAEGQREIRSREQEIQDAENKLNTGEQQISGKKAELAAGKTKLEQAQKELDAQEKRLLEQEKKLAGQEKQLIQQKTQLTENAQQIKEQKAGLAGQKTELNSKISQLEQAYAAQAVSQEEYEKNLALLQGGLAQAEAAQKELQAAESKIQSGLAQVQDGLVQIQTGKKEIKAGRKKLEAGKKETASRRAELQDGQAQLAAAEKDAADARMQLENGKKEIARAKIQLAQGQAELQDGQAQLAQAQTELARAEAELEQGQKELEQGQKELADAKTQYAQAEAEFEQETADAQKEITDARRELADLKQPDSYALDRNTNIGYACFESDSNIVAAIADVFPAFFFLVAALVCMTTMNRMVEEQRTQIGVFKALGYGNAAIMGKYLFYAGSAALAGAAAGCAGGTWLFPKVIWMGYRIMYSMGDIQYYFDIRLAVLSAAAALLCSMGAAYVSCRYELYSVPAELIRPKAPKSGKRIFLEKLPVIWGRMKFLHKVSVRNVFRYKKRFFMMILGIGGCTALLVTGFGIKDSVTGIADMQYDEVQTYDLSITFSRQVKKEDVDALARQAGNMLAQTACRYEESVNLDFGGRTKSVYLEVPEKEEEIGAFLNLHTKSGAEIPYPKEGEAVLTSKLAENMGIRAGDEIQLRDHDGKSLRVTVAALCENFVYHYIYINKETYSSQLGKQPEYKSAYAAVKESVDIHAAAAALSDQDHVLAVTAAQDMRNRIGAMMESMDYIVILIIVCAGSLAFIVLYNLTNINITERIREIATIKVLGFYSKETADYVFRENLVLTGIGAVLGIGLGKWLHWFVMYQVNIDMLSFKTIIRLPGYLWSLILTFAFAMFVNAVMYFKLEKINMAESLKSIE